MLDLPEAFVPGFGHGAPSPYKRRKMKKKYKNKLEKDAHSLLTKHHISERRRFDSEHELTLQKEKISDFLAEVHMGRRRRRPGAMEKVEPPPKKQKKEPEAAEKPEEKEYTPDVDVREIAEQYKPTTTVDPSLTEKYLGDEPATEPVSGPPEVAPPPPPGVAPPQSTVPDILQRYAEETPDRPSLTAALPRVPPPPPPMVADPREMEALQGQEQAVAQAQQDFTRRIDEQRIRGQFDPTEESAAKQAGQRAQQDLDEQRIRAQFDPTEESAAKQAGQQASMDIDERAVQEARRPPSPPPRGPPGPPPRRPPGPPMDVDLPEPTSEPRAPSMDVDPPRTQNPPRCRPTPPKPNRTPRSFKRNLRWFHGSRSNPPLEWRKKLKCKKRP